MSSTNRSNKADRLEFVLVRNLRPLLYYSGHTSKETIPIVNFLEKAETHGETELVQGRSTARGASVNSINPKVFRILVSPSINVYAGERDIVTELLFINSFVNYL